VDRRQGVCATHCGITATMLPRSDAPLEALEWPVTTTLPV